MIKVTADSFIPFLKGRLEPYVQIQYLHPDEFTPEAVKDSDALLIRTRTRIDAPLLEGSKVQFVASGTIGMDQFNLPWCEQKGIVTKNSPGCNAPGVAQYVWNSLLRCGVNPQDITIGIVGYGNVGHIVAEWGRHLGAEVILCDPPRARQYADEDYVSINELLSRSDVVTLHVPLTRTGSDATYHMIGEAQLARMQKGAILLNAARGPIVDTTAVVKAAQRGSIRVITDCWEGEPDAISHELMDLSLIATPHIAGYSLEGKQRATRMIIESLAAHFNLPLATAPGQPGIKIYDLAPKYEPRQTLTREQVLAGYYPLHDDAALRAAPAAFEHLRDHYAYRPEPALLGSVNPCQ